MLGLVSRVAAINWQAAVGVDVVLGSVAVAISQQRVETLERLSTCSSHFPGCLQERVFVVSPIWRYKPEGCIASVRYR